MIVSYWKQGPKLACLGTPYSILHYLPASRVSVRGNSVPASNLLTCSRLVNSPVSITLTLATPSLAQPSRCRSPHALRRRAFPSNFGCQHRLMDAVVKGQKIRDDRQLGSTLRLTECWFRHRLDHERSKVLLRNAQVSGSEIYSGLGRRCAVENGVRYHYA